MKQHSFAGLAYENKKRKTRRERFLDEMDAVIPWKTLTGTIAPHYPKPPADAAGTDAADLLYAAVVRSFRSGDGRRLV
jgi:hypothetical protein